jgi:hypothetical protein
MLEIYQVIHESYLDSTFVTDETGPFDYFTAETEQQAKRYFKKNYKGHSTWTYQKIEMYMLNHEISVARKKLERQGKEVGDTVTMIEKLRDIQLRVIASKKK